MYRHEKDLERGSTVPRNAHMRALAWKRAQKVFQNNSFLYKLYGNMQVYQSQQLWSSLDSWKCLKFIIVFQKSRLKIPFSPPFFLSLTSSSFSARGITKRLKWYTSGKGTYLSCPTVEAGDAGIGTQILGNRQCLYLGQSLSGQVPMTTSLCNYTLLDVTIQPSLSKSHSMSSLKHLSICSL